MQILQQQSKLEVITVEFQTVLKQNGEKEHMFTQQIEEVHQEKIHNEKDAEMTRCVQRACVMEKSMCG